MGSVCKCFRRRKSLFTKKMRKMLCPWQCSLANRDCKAVNTKILRQKLKNIEVYSLKGMN